MAVTTLAELEEQVTTDLGAIRHEQLEQNLKADAREHSAKKFRKEVRTRLGTLETGMAEVNGRLTALETSVTELKTGMASILELLRARA